MSSTSTTTDIGTKPKLVVMLASSSQWRQQVVQSVIDSLNTTEGKEFELHRENIAPDIDEKAIRDADAGKMVLAIARAKAEAVLAQLFSTHSTVDANAIDLIITADQVVKFGDAIREKPTSKEQAKEFLQSYGKSGIPGICVNGLVVSKVDYANRTSKSVEGIGEAKVFWDTIPDDVADQAIEEGSIFTSAGAFVVESPILKPYLKKIEGEYEAVLGLPKTKTRELLCRAAEL